VKDVARAVFLVSGEGCGESCVPARGESCVPEPQPVRGASCALLGLRLRSSSVGRSWFSAEGQCGYAPFLTKRRQLCGATDPKQPRTNIIIVYIISVYKYLYDLNIVRYHHDVFMISRSWALGHAICRRRNAHVPWAPASTFWFITSGVLSVCGVVECAPRVLKRIWDNNNNICFVKNIFHKNTLKMYIQKKHIFCVFLDVNSDVN